MEISYINQMNAFLEKSIGVLGAREQAVYLRLFGIWNGLRRPEYFDVADSQIARELSASRWTVIRARKELRERGFISYINPHRRRPIKYHLPLLYVDDCANLQQSQESDCANLQQSLLQNCTTSVADLHTSKRRDRDSSCSSSDHGGTQYESKAIAAYINDIEPMAGAIVLEELQDLVDTYGDELTLKAVKIAATSNVHSVRFVAGTLRNIKRDKDKAEKKTRPEGRAKPKRLANEKAVDIYTRVCTLIDEGETDNGQDSRSPEENFNGAGGGAKSLPAVRH